MFSYIDFLSPPITLFHLEKRTHTSKIGGCLVTFLVTISIGYIAYLLYYLISHNRVTLIFFKKFEFEAGYYSFNSSSIFHFIQIFSPDNGGYFGKYDNRYIRAYITYVHSNFKDSDLELYDHWVFDTCRKDEDDKGLEPSLFENVVNFSNAVCIKHFYNSTEKKYYSLEEEGFLWPYLEHGTAQTDNIYLTTVVQKCTNDSIINKLFGSCPSQKEIDEYISQYFAIYLYFTDTQVDPTNYSNPVQKYLHTLITGIGTSQTYVESYIHFSPIKVKTKVGTLFSNSKEIDTFYFDFCRKGSANNNQKYFTLTKYYHLMQNNVQIYERRYNNVFDLLSEIGGVVQFLFYIFFWINFVYNKYIIAYDTNSLFFAVKDNDIRKIDIKNQDSNNNSLINNENSNNLNKITLLMNKNINNDFIGINSKKPIQKFISLQGISKQMKSDLKFNNYNTNSKLDQNDEALNIDIMKKKKRRRKSEIINLDNNKKAYYYLNSINLSRQLNNNGIWNKHKNMPSDQNCSKLKLKDGNNFGFKNDDISLRNFDADPRTKNKGKMTKTINYGINEADYYNKIWLSKNSIARIDHKTIILRKISNKERIKSVKNLSFFLFLKSFCFDRKGSIDFVIKFRKHLLSEEHLFKSHIKTILLEKEFNSKNVENTNVFECFNEL